MQVITGLDTVKFLCLSQKSIFHRFCSLMKNIVLKLVSFNLLIVIIYVMLMILRSESMTTSNEVC